MVAVSTCDRCPVGEFDPEPLAGRLSRIAADEVHGDKESISEKNQDEKREREGKKRSGGPRG